MNEQASNPLSSNNSSMLAVIGQDLFKQSQTLPQDILENDPVDFDLSSSQHKELPLGFKEIAPKLHKNYLYWQHLRDNYQPTQPTFYRYLKSGIDKTIKKGNYSQASDEKKVLLLLETRFTFMTLTSLISAAEDYLQENYLQDAKESIDTALSTLYEFLKTREMLETSLAQAIESIKADIINESETYQYVSYLLSQVIKLNSSDLIQLSKLYVVKKQLEKFQEILLTLLPKQPIKNVTNQGVNKRKIERLMTQLIRVMIAEEKYIIQIESKKLVNALSFSPDSTYLAMTSIDGNVNLIDLLTLEEFDLVKHNDSVNSISFSPDGIYLATASDDGTAKLIDIDNLREARTISHMNRVNMVSFSPNGNYLATASDDGRMKLIAIANLKQIGTIQHENKVNSVSFSPDSTYLATASDDGTAKLIEIANFREVGIIGHQDRINSVSFSPDGMYLATASSDSTAKLIAVKTLEEVAIIQHGYEVYSVSFPLNQTYLATASSNKNAKLFNLSILKEKVVIYQETWVQSVSFSSDGMYLIAALYDNTVTLIEVKTGKEVTSISHISHVKSVSFSPKGTYLVIVLVDKIQLIEIATLKEITTIKQDNSLKVFSFSPDEHYLVTVLLDKTIKLVNLPKLLELGEEEKEDNFSAATAPETSGIVHLQKAQAFFLSWLRTESNHYSFYEYMLTQAEQSKEGLSVKYCLPILETNLLLQSLGFLLVNAENHYQTVYPSLSQVNDVEIRGLAMQDMKQSISAALSTLYEFLAARLEFDQEDYQQGIERLKDDIEQNIENTDIFLQVYHNLQVLLHLEGIKHSSELKTLKEMLEAIEKIVKPILPQEIIDQNLTHSSISVKKDLSRESILNAIYEADEFEIIPLLTKIQELGLLNNTIAFGIIVKVSPQEVTNVCQQLPQEVINQEVAIAAVKKRRQTHYIGTLLFWIDISNKETLLKILQSAPRKRWWLR